ncbi:hypothetical protein AVEN_190964-1 [Araneus ventricosus]|uniref:Uncharacterized protein n=1 Tax=Araneus ventricosus TaxID=182803 RepID=A0A4Y2VFJ0_ARAVE|nr:hypothetical protein AVEN_190964-1 [Araneus ventricosus]
MSVRLLTECGIKVSLPNLSNANSRTTSSKLFNDSFQTENFKSKSIKSFQQLATSKQEHLKAVLSATPSAIFSTLNCLFADDLAILAQGSNIIIKTLPSQLDSIEY